MNTQAALPIAFQANSIQAILQQYVAPFGGVASVVSNLKDLWSRPYNSSQSPRALVCYMGERIREQFSVAAILHRVDREFAVAITRGRGFYVNRGDSLSQNMQEIPFYDVVESVRDLIRSINSICPVEELPIDFKTIRPMNNGNLVIDGYIIEFSIGSPLPELSDTAQLPSDQLQP